MKSITVEEARHCLLTAAIAYKKETEVCGLLQAGGRVLAQEVKAPDAVPAFARSPYDGFAIPYEEGRNEFTIVATIGAGEVYERPVKAGEAVRIMTGAAIPDGCDTVVMQERCTWDGACLCIRGEVRKGENIIPRGEECEKGTLLLEPGIAMGAGQLAVAAGMGVTDVRVYHRPRVVVLTSGREIIAPGEPMKKGNVYNSNLYMLQGLLAAQGLTAQAVHHISDDPHCFAAETKHVQALMNDADVLISTGGVSVGMYDSMPAMYEALGAEALYGRIQMRPGAASYGGVIRRSTANPIFCLGLSGNPTAAYNSFLLLAVPLLRYLGGYGEPILPRLKVSLGAAVHKTNPFDRYVQGVIEWDDGVAVFYPNEIYTSGALLGMAKTNALAKLEKGHTDYSVGDLVEVITI